MDAETVIMELCKYVLHIPIQRADGTKSNASFKHTSFWVCVPRFRYR